MRLLYREYNDENNMKVSGAFSIYALNQYIFAISHPECEYMGRYHRFFILLQTNQYHENSTWDEWLCADLAQALYRNQPYKIFDTGSLKDYNGKYMGYVKQTLYFAYCHNSALQIKRYDHTDEEQPMDRMTNLLIIESNDRWNHHTNWSQGLFIQFAMKYL